MDDASALHDSADTSMAILRERMRQSPKGLLCKAERCIPVFLHPFGFHCSTLA
jgi:hypothetical protein